ncbi:AI-2E family transporter [Cellulomonas alba]|uniref:AI-2E family transporter n=1 Tax=Cellulomonas alba TaxID=3053467 RepID=A0ABT7SJP0_9CELL|nr:AI-2E family transporter [Cellulomonas alba]MDM7856398.1 AI-2E family transporter [Cellulomonas alba]
MSEVPGGPTRHTTTAPSVRTVAGARRNPNVYGNDYDAPRWLRATAGVSWRLLVVALAVVVIFTAVWHVQLLLIAVFIALVVSAVLRPAVDWLAKGMPRFAATAVALIGGILFFLGLLTWVGYSVASQWDKLSAQFSDGIGQITDFLESGNLPFKVTSDQVAQWIDTGRDWVQTHSGEIASAAASRTGSVVEVFTTLALALFCAVFFLARGTDMWTWFLNQLPARHRETWKTAGGAGWYTFSGYARGTVIIAVTEGGLAFIILTILRVPLSAPLSVLVFIGAFIPLIGGPAAMVVAMLVALAANGVWSAIFVGVGIALIGQFEGHFLQPLIMGRQVKIHPVVIALAVTGGTLLGGLLGAVIAVPLISVCWSIFSRLRTLDPPMDEEEEDEVEEDVEPVDEAVSER